MTTELKPCPFCGGEAIAGKTCSEEIIYVFCKECEVEVQDINAWNTRATPSPVPELERYTLSANKQRMVIWREGEYVRYDQTASVITELKQLISDYEDVNADKKRLTRLLDVALHGEENAAQQASLCDLITPAKQLRSRAETAEAKLAPFENQVPIGYVSKSFFQSFDIGRFHSIAAYVMGEK